jgi:(1->4)-alpha-D-glucan 1-alpha-D-glucosylmutase
VDPDNRRPVDFELRRLLLDQLSPWLDGPEGPAPAVRAVSTLLRDWSDGRIKLFLTAAGLRLRRRHLPVFLEGEYRPLVSAGPDASHLVALARIQGPMAVLAILPRLPATLVGWDRGTGAPCGEAVWGETAVPLPGDLATASWRNVFTGKPLRSVAGRVSVADALAELPWGLFVAADAG